MTDYSEWIQIKLDRDSEIYQSIADYVVKAVQVKAEGHQSKFDDDDDVLGPVGELAFQKYIEPTNIPFDKDKTHLADRYDFLIYEKTIDCKTSPTDDEYFIMNNVWANTSQIEHHLLNYYVFIKYDDDSDTCYILGWRTGESIVPLRTYEEWNGKKLKSPAKKVSVDTLRPIGELLIKLKGGD